MDFFTLIIIILKQTVYFFNFNLPRLCDIMSVMNYLYMLQTIRESCPDFINRFFMLVSDMVQNLGFMLPAFIYWCVSKTAGTKMFLCYSTTFFSNQLIKNTACVYRPWIRYPELTPYAAAKPSATGYSFPSGHTVSAASFFGSVAVFQKKKKWVVILMFTLIFLTAFSRNWLGVHTIQDVLVAILEGAFFICIFEVLSYWFASHQDKDILLCIIGIVLVIAGLLYLQFKPYPMDYLEDGSLLVDPYDMLTDCYTAAGLSASALLGWLIDRRFIHYETAGSWKNKIICFLIGGLIVFAEKVGLGYVFAPLGTHFSHLLKYFILGITTMIFYPMGVMAFRKKHAAKKSDDEK